MPRDAASAVVSQTRLRDPDRTRAAILSAATSEFAAHGLGGARVDRIAAQSKSNKRMLYYYFGDKEGLYVAVLEAAYERIRGEEQKLDLRHKPPREGVRELCIFTWRYFVAHPEFLSLLNTENLHRARYLKHSNKVRALHSPLIATLSELLERGRRERVFRDGVDPVQLYISIAALGYFYLSNAHTLSTIFGRNLLAPRARSARLDHIVGLVLGSLESSALAGKSA
ncbi:MAG TPA: TetR family transcriptional regulator [Casimicrobiaceae bacterium]|nr:TetR family transcriptional regulator [Casimicrobiaceae bacterium]